MKVRSLSPNFEKILAQTRKIIQKIDGIQKKIDNNNFKVREVEKNIKDLNNEKFRWANTSEKQKKDGIEKDLKLEMGKLYNLQQVENKKLFEEHKAMIISTTETVIENVQK